MTPLPDSITPYRPWKVKWVNNSTLNEYTLIPGDYDLLNLCQMNTKLKFNLVLDFDD